MFVSIKFDAICGPDFGRYCKYQLIKFKYSEGEPTNAFSNEEESDEMFINTNHLFLHTDIAETYVLGHTQEMSTFFHENHVRMKKVKKMVITMTPMKVKMMEQTIINIKKLMIGCCFTG